MHIEKEGTDLVLTIADSELERDPSILDRAADLALEISTVFSLRVVVSPKEFALHRDLFGTRFSKAPGKNWNLTIRRVIPTRSHRDVGQFGQLDLGSRESRPAFPGAER
jgi:hypothetical protein